MSLCLILQILTVNLSWMVQAAQPPAAASSSSKGGKDAATKAPAAEVAGKTKGGKNNSNVSSKKADVIPAGSPRPVTTRVLPTLARP